MLKLKPALKNYLWGGTKLGILYGRDNGGDKISESWEVSVHPDGLSMSDDCSLYDYIRKNPESVDNNQSHFPILIKYIDAMQNLSVQVHPNDEYAMRVEGDNGKTEVWYIVDADEGSGIYCGFKKDTDKDEFLRKVKDGSVEELLNFIPVQKGDCFLIEAGTVHAIGGGCVICEIQQSSNVTYRVYDYNRRGADGQLRPLHIDKALEVINFSKYEDRTYTQPEEKFLGGSMQILTDCKYFCCRKLRLTGKYKEKSVNSFTAINVIKGSGNINGTEFVAGDSFFIPCGEQFVIEGKGEFILSSESSQKYYAGLDLGGTFIKCGIVDSYGRVLAKDKVPTDGRYENTVKDMVSLVKSLSEKTGIKLSGIGIGAPGTIDSANGMVYYSNNIKWKKAPLAKDIAKLTGVKTVITNDANSAGLGEFAYGAGRNYNSIVFVTLGTGVGGGIILDGKLFEGNKSAGAEIGHIQVKSNGEKCTCGRRGCLEAYASTTALLKQAKEQMLKNRDSSLWTNCDGDIELLDGIRFFKSYREGDGTAQKVFKKYIEYLSNGLISIANVIRPEAIIIGGGISAVGDILINPLKQKVNKGLFGGSKYAPVDMLIAELCNDAGMLGAAKLAMDSLK